MSIPGIPHSLGEQSLRKAQLYGLVRGWLCILFREV